MWLSSAPRIRSRPVGRTYRRKQRKEQPHGRNSAGHRPCGATRRLPHRPEAQHRRLHHPTPVRPGPAHGTFTLLDGEIHIGNPVGESTARATIDAASFTTNNAKRDADVKSPKLLDVAQYPTIDFIGELTHETDRGYQHAGALTAHGITQPVRVTIDEIAESVPEINLKASIRIDRYAFGVTKVKGMAGRHLICAWT